MKPLRLITALALAGALAASTTGCGDTTPARTSDDCTIGPNDHCQIPAGALDDDELDCEISEQNAHDDDCGYYANGVWTWYPWVVWGSYSKPQRGWKKPTPPRTAARPTGAARPTTGTRTSAPKATRTKATTTNRTSRTGKR